MPVSADAFRGRGVAGAAVTLLAVMLPALVCGAHLDMPVQAAEIERLRTAVTDPQGQQLGPAMLFYGALLPMELGDDLSVHAPRARLATVLGVLVLSGLLYSVSRLVRSRATGFLACVALAALPATSNCALRPEIPVAVFGLLAALVLVGMPHQLRLRVRRSALGHAAIVGLLAFVVGMATALAVASQASYGVFLLVPGACLLLASVLGLSSFLATQRRRGFSLAPFWGFTRNTMPWLAAAFAALGFATCLLHDNESPTLSSATLLPDSIWAATPFVVLAAVGVAYWTLHVGLTIGRKRRVDGNAVLLVYAIAMMTHRIRLEDGADGLPAAPAFAVMIAMGARVVLVWWSGLWLRRARQRG